MQVNFVWNGQSVYGKFSASMTEEEVINVVKSMDSGFVGFSRSLPLNVNTNYGFSHPDMEFQFNDKTSKIRVLKEGREVYNGCPSNYAIRNHRWHEADVHEMFRFVYHGGSSPGTKRAVKILEVHPTYIHAEELSSGLAKNYTTSLIKGVEKI